MSKLSRFLLFVFAVVVIIGSASCRKDPDFDKLSTNFVVGTNIDKAAVFSSYKTYYISDTIGYITGSGTDTILYDANAKMLVDAVKQNMNARGYTFVPKSSKPDVGFNMGIAKNITIGVYYPGWWWGYPGWWYPWYWGYGSYSYYYPWSIAYAVTTGTVSLEMVDLKNAPNKRRLQVLWSSLMGGAIGSSTPGNFQNGVTSINQAFTQSPAIQTK
jgi:hypothetical protein